MRNCSRESEATRPRRCDGATTSPVAASINRRGAIGAAAAIAAACLSKQAVAQRSDAAQPGARRSISFFVGSHQHGRPDNTDRFSPGTFAATKNSMEPFDYGPIRSHNVEALNRGSHNRWWIGRDARANRYDWDILDRWVHKVTSRGHPILLNLFGVPEFAARLRDFRDVYGVTGGTSGPAELIAWQEFVRDTTARIIERSGVESLIAVEAWNEPIGDDVDGNGKFLVSRRYAVGHRDPQGVLLADITKHTYLGVRSVSAARDVPVLCGAQAYLDSKNLDRMLDATTTTGEPILRYCDAVSFHPYGVFDGNGIQPSLTDLTRAIQRKLSQRGAAHLRLWASEVGLNAPWHVRVAKWWGSLTTTQRTHALYEWISLYKRLGWRAVMTYSSESTDDFLGSPQQHREIAESLSRAYWELQG